MKPDQQLEASLNDIQTGSPTPYPVGVTGLLYRAVDGKYLASVNSVAGSTKADGRYHDKDDALGTLYLADSPRVLSAAPSSGGWGNHPRTTDSIPNDGPPRRSRLAARRPER